MKKDKKQNAKAYLESTTDRVGEIAVHYGFMVIKPPHISSDDISKSKQFKDFDKYSDAEEKVALTRWYMDNRMDLEAQPLLVHYKKPLPGRETRKKPGTDIYGFEIMGSNRSTSEAVMLRCVLSVLEDLGYKNLFIDINSIGDRESISKFEKELHSHFRKNVQNLPAKVRQEFKKNNYSILTNKSPELKEFLETAPQTIASLSDISRSHFKEVLESIETFNVVYKIKPDILPNKLYASYTIFEIRNLPEKTETAGEGDVLAYGYRYNYLAKKIGGKREIPTMSATILVKRNPAMAKKIIIKNIKKPRFYLVQLGSTAKLKALNIVEMLRKHKIPVHHSITKDKITGQLSGAEYMRSSHVLIMGQKEAIENTIVVRDVVSREQETVSLENLPEFLKKIGKEKKGKK